MGGGEAMSETTTEVEHQQEAEWPDVPKVGIEKLLDTVNTASGHCRTLYYSFLLLMLFVAVIVGSTQDEQLLLQSPLTLPIVGIGVPIAGVYMIVPPLFVILHFNLFLQLYLLSRKAAGFERKIEAIKSAGAFDDEDLLRETADPFALTQLLIGGRHLAGIRLFLRTIITTVMIVFPLGLMLWIQVRFLPYHSNWINILHAALTILDLVMCWYFWPRILGRGRSVWGRLKETRSKPWGLVRMSVAGGLSIGCLYVTLFAAVVPDSEDDHGIESLYGRYIEWNLLDWLSPEAYGGLRYLDVAEATLVVNPAPLEILAAAAAEGEKAVEDARVRYTEGLDLRGLDLRKADFSRATLYNADLRRANLKGANLSYAKLRGAKIRADNGENHAKLAAAILVGVDFQGRDLRGINLKGADLREAQLQGADLQQAQLQGADLRKAQLQGAYLPQADLHGVNLSGAQLQSVDLSKGELGGANLKDVDLSLADLRNVSFTLLDEEAWLHIRDVVASRVPEGGNREEMRVLIDEAIKRQTSIQPKLAENVLYDPTQHLPEFAYMAERERWKPPSGEAEFSQVLERRAEYLVSLACKNQHVDTGIARRIIYGRDDTMASTLLDKPHILQAKEQECNGLREIRKALKIYRLKVAIEALVKAAFKIKL